MSNPEYKSQAARDAQKSNYGDKSYWDSLDKSAQESHAYFVAKGDEKKANEMLTCTLSQALAGNDGI